MLFFKTGASRYRAEVASDDANVNIPAPILTTERTATFEDLSYGTGYRFTVIAIGAQDQESDDSRPVERIIGVI